MSSEPHAEFIQLSVAAGDGSAAGKAGAPAAGKHATKKDKRKQQHQKRAAPPVRPDDVRERMHKYQRPNAAGLGQITDKKARGLLRAKDAKAKKSAMLAARSELLLADTAGSLEAEGMERTYKFSQPAIAAAVDVSSAQKAFDLDLPTFAPYAIDYTRNGRHLLIGGRKGHVAAFDWRRGRLAFELQVGETVRDVTWLHNEMLCAVAQRRHVYIYDHTGSEVQVLEQHVDPTVLDFLPYHFLLVSVGHAGYLKYHDTSIGKLVVEHRTRLGPCHVMAQNPYNAVMHLGHNSGVVTLWTPNMSQPAVKMLAHRGPVQALAVDPTGHYMTTSGLDGQLKVWDIRAFRDRPLHEYYTHAPATTLHISQRGMTAVGYGAHVEVWRDMHAAKQPAPYLTHMIGGAAMAQVRFAPFEDVLGLGHSKGFSSILVPGAGEANYDAFEANPFQTKKQRQEAEVHQLLEKIKPDLITLNPNDILTVRKPHEIADAGKKLRAAAAAKPAKKAGDGDNDDDDDEDSDAAEGEAKFQPKHKMRGRSSSKRRFLRKQINVIDGKREAIKAKLEEERQKREAARKNGGRPGDGQPDVLARFGGAKRA